MKRIKKWDKVQVISWKFKWKISTVDKTDDEMIFVNWVNIVKKAIKKEWYKEKHLPIHVSNVMIYCDKCKKNVKIWFTFDDKWKKIRVCKNCNNKF